jgi:phage terminase small subunit
MQTLQRATTELLPLEPTALTVQQEAFARACVESSNYAAAYRAVFDPPASTPRGLVNQWAHRLRIQPAVAARIETLREELAKKAILSRERVIAWLVAQITTDANELVTYSRYGCRHCHGEGFAYQWKDEDEFTASYIATVDANAAIPAGKRKLTMPKDDGGYGYHKGTEPNPLCPECLGNGTAEAIIKDTTKLTGGALALYAGVKETAAGTVVLMHDKTKLLDQLCRMMGWNKDTLGGGLQPPGSQAHMAMPEQINEQDAAKHYLRLVGGVA